MISARISHPNERPRKPFDFLFYSRDHEKFIIQIYREVNLKMRDRLNHLCMERGEVSWVVENHFQEHRILIDGGPTGVFSEPHHEIAGSHI